MVASAAIFGIIHSKSRNAWLPNENYIMFSAKVTLQQLTQSQSPQGRLKAMIGAKDFAQDEEKQMVQFKFPMAKGVNFCKITLTSQDLYDIEFGKIGKKADPEMKALGIKMMVSSYKVKTTLTGYYDEMLKEAFESTTGLYLSL